MDEFTIDPRAGAGIDKMGPRDPTLPNRTDAQPLVQPRQCVLGCRFCLPMSVTK